MEQDEQVVTFPEGVVEKGTLSGIDVDGIIMQAMAAEGLALERQRRADWSRVERSAASFSDLCGRPGP